MHKRDLWICQSSPFVRRQMNHDERLAVFPQRQLMPYEQLFYAASADGHADGVFDGFGGDQDQVAAASGA